MRKHVIGICFKCEEEKVVNVNKKLQKPICTRCFRRHYSPKRKCSICGEKRRDVFNYRQAKKPACSKCYKKHLQPKVICSVCSKERIVAAYDGQGQPLCAPCLRTGPGAQRCSLCSQKRMICSYTDEGEPICHLCHKSFINLKVCSQCGKKKSVAKKLATDTYLCRACVEENSKGICPRCTNHRALANRVDGQLVCRPCKWESQTAECQTCHRDRPIVSRGQCGSCYHTSREKRAVERIQAMVIGTVVYRKTTKERGKIVGIRQPVARGRKRFFKADFQVHVIDGRWSEEHIFWPAIECALIKHGTHFKPPEPEVTAEAG